MIVVEYFTKWLEAYAIPNQEALTMVEALVTNFFCHLGVSQSLHSDKGCNFETCLMQVLQFLEVSKMYTTPLHPQLDSMAVL
jgi:hypothetical protein